MDFKLKGDSVKQDVEPNLSATEGMVGMSRSAVFCQSMTLPRGPLQHGVPFCVLA